MGEDLLDTCLSDTKMLIFDESTQAMWAVIVHLVSGMKQLEKLLLTGDKHQLGVHLADFPTILQNGFGLESVLEQVECSKGVRYTFLTKCYRSHPKIVECISVAKYEPEEKLISGTSAEDRSLLTASKFPLPKQNVPIVLINSKAMCRQDPCGPSLTNDIHEDCAIMLVDSLLNEFGENILERTVVLCMYLYQAAELKAAFNRRGEYNGLQVVSVDAYQSQENDVVILITTRTRNRDEQVKMGMDFFKDDRRACVALTRARHAIFLIGDLVHVSEGQVWQKFIAKAIQSTSVVKEDYCAAVYYNDAERRADGELHGKFGSLVDSEFLREWQRTFGNGEANYEGNQENSINFSFAYAAHDQPGPSRPNVNVVDGRNGNVQNANRGGRVFVQGGGARGSYRGMAKNKRSQQ